MELAKCLLHVLRFDLICNMQIRATDKTKQIFWVPVKFLIATLSLYYLYHNLSEDFSNFNNLPSYSSSSIIILIFSLLLLSLGNWSLEFKKWQLLVKQISFSFSFYEAFKQTLIGHAANLLTPLKIVCRAIQKHDHRLQFSNPKGSKLY